jgi:hypothetical protein
MGGQAHGGAKGETPVYRCPDRGRCDEPSVITAERLDGFVRELVLDRLQGLRLEAVNDGVDLAGADRALEEAEGELRAFAADVDARRVLGEAGWQDALAARAKDRDEKREERERAYGEYQLVAVAEDINDLDDADLRDLLHGIVRNIFVRRGPRGTGPGDRTLVVWSDDPRAIDVPGPHRSGPFEPIRW